MRNRIVVTEPLYSIKCQLGEGPLWDEARNALHFVDVGNNCIHHLELSSLELTTDYYNECIASLSFCKNRSDSFIAACRGGFAYLPIAPQQVSSPQSPLVISYMCENPVPQDLRDQRMFNDSACDAVGRIFSGSKTLRGQPFNEDQLPGRIYKLEAHEGEWRSEEMTYMGAMTVPNGIAFSPDNKALYVADTRSLHILAFDYDLAKGSVSNKRVFVETGWDGRPDGMCVDTEGCVWSAKYGGARVTRYTSAGEIETEIQLPKCLNVTSIAFGGPNRDTAFITSGSLNESGDDVDPVKVKKYPESGSLFSVRIAGVRGIEKYCFDDVATMDHI